MSAMENKIQYIKDATIDMLAKSCNEWRNKLIGYFSVHGGHVGSSLGVVELLVSALREYDYQKDRFIFDVGHQAYLLKMFFWGDEEMRYIRRSGGPSGFTNKSENPRDLYTSGHGGSGLSFAIGLHNSYDEKQGDGTKNTLCIIGDGSFSEGVVYESLNNLRNKNSGCKLIIVLNDNGYAIEENVGNISKVLSVPKKANAFFELFGLNYIRCDDGHDLNSLIEGWRKVKNSAGNCVYHVKTIKGYGLQCALDDCRRFHYTEPFDVETGRPKEQRGDLIRYVDVNSRALIDLSKERDDLVVVTAAMRGGNGLDDYYKAYPNRFFDVGMAEQYAVGVANGISVAGKIPIIAIHSAFLPRAYDQFIQDICLQGIHVVLLVARSGFAGPDGPTHHGVFDLSYLRCIPGVTIYSPSSGEEYYAMIHYAVNKSYGTNVILTPHAYTAFSYDKIAEYCELNDCINMIENGSDILVLATGPLLNEALKLADRVKEAGMRCGLGHIKRIKPLDEGYLRELMSRYDRILVMEENSVIGGVGSEIALISANDKSLPPVKVWGVVDRFIPHGDIESLRKEAGVISERVIEELMDDNVKRWRNMDAVYA